MSAAAPGVGWFARLLRYDGWANTEALRRANLLSGSETSTPNSEIVRDTAGLATGELRESGAYKPVLELIPPPSDVKNE